ncbi:MAG: hypothetical protein IJU63_07145 [Bacteroidales bacterium]|nr:hypothetical protein [Bacteroidales bacterium]
MTTKSLPLILSLCLALAACGRPDPQTIVRLGSAEPGAAVIPDDYVGLSYESKMLVPDGNGQYYFNVENKPLVTLFRTLGIRSIRIGGSSTDNPNDPLPSLADIDNFFRFAREVGVKVIYSVRLRDGDPDYARSVAALIQNKYSDRLDLFAIGNEPGYYKNAYEEELKPRWASIREAVNSAFPGARFCAPDDNPNPPLCSFMLDNFGSHIGLLTMHYYPGDCAYTNPFKVQDVSELIPFDPAVKRELLLSDDLHPKYEGVLKRMAPVFERAPYRLSETNSIWYGGLKDASDSYASALWALDYMYWWASRGSAGINFHTGDYVGGGDGTVVSRYATFVTEGDGFDVRPISYALKAFGEGAKGTLVPVQIDGETDRIDAYAAVRAGTVSITLINRRYGDEAQPRTVSIDLGACTPAGKASVLRLEAEGNDTAARTGVTLGRVPIRPDGTWDHPVRETLRPAKGSLTITLKPASAAVITLPVK